MLGERRGLEGGGEVTVAGSEVDAEMSAVEVGTDGGGAFLSLNFIVKGYDARCMPGQPSM